jgi:DNA mismatch endonuclease (patch repair protein)
MSDNLTKEQRRLAMSRVRQENTDIEKIVRSELRKIGLKFRTNVKHLPGKPDIVIPMANLAVFVDGDFWHGHRFPAWRDKLKPFWRAKIARNRLRDRRNFRKLRTMNWRVVRIWQHEIKRDLGRCLSKILLQVGPVAVKGTTAYVRRRANSKIKS